MLEWDEKYSLGIDIIDSHHKKLVSIGNDLYTLLSERSGDDIFDEMVAIINEFRDYTVFHFDFEEKLFERFNYPDSEAHMAEHKKFIDSIVNIDLRAVDEDQAAHGMKILKFVIDWIYKHISGTDAKYVGFFKGKI